uniref:RAN binding protein 2 n=1 Tax=Takifugu rubripes TaxID=31033 RepID=A0A674NYH2_TAKRU
MYCIIKQKVVCSFLFLSFLQKSKEGFSFAKLYFEVKEYELAKRYVLDHLKIYVRDYKAHKFLGQLFEREGEINKAVRCYKRSVGLNPAQKDLVLKVAELLVSKQECDSTAPFWVEKAAKLHPGHPAVFNLKECLSHQGQQSWNQLYLLQAEMTARPADAHVNVKLVQLLNEDGRLEEAVKHCLATEKRGMLRHSLEWYTVVLHTLQPSVSCNEKMCRPLQRELLLAHCSLLRITLSDSSMQPSLDALKSFDESMHTLSRVAGRYTDDLFEMFMEMRGHLYLHAGTLLLKLAQDRQQTWMSVSDLAALCYLLAYQVQRPKSKMTKRDQSCLQLLELLANDRQSQAGHMLFSLSTNATTLIGEVFGNRSGQDSLFELLYGPHASTASSFIANDDIHTINPVTPDLLHLAKCDSGSILLHGGDLQHLTWLGLQWTLRSQRPEMRRWLKQLFPLHNLETSKLDSSAPESICLLDLEVFLYGVVFCCHCQLQETAKISGGMNEQQQQLYQPRCLPVPLLRLLTTGRQREWWNAIYSLIHGQAVSGTSAKLRMIVQHGLNTLRGGEKHGLQPAMLIHWAQSLSQMVHTFLEIFIYSTVIPRPCQSLKREFQSNYQLFKAFLAYATLLDIEGKTEEAIATLETVNTMSSVWHLAQIYQRLSKKASNGREETQDRCVTLLRNFQTYLLKMYNANADDIDKIPISMEEIVDLLSDVNHQLVESGGTIDEQDDEGQKGPAHSSPAHPNETSTAISHLKFSTPSPNKSIVSPTKRHLISPKTPPHWVEDQKSLVQMLCQQVEALKKEVHDLRQSASVNAGSPHHKMYGDSYGAEGLQETFNPVQSYHGAPQTAHNSQYLLHTAANVTPTKEICHYLAKLTEINLCISGNVQFWFSFPLVQHPKNMEGTKHSEILLDLLTSDIPAKNDTATDSSAVKEKQPSQSGIFTFGSTGTGNISGKTENLFKCGEVSKPAFGIPKSPAGEEKTPESDNDNTHVEEDEDGPHFEPIVPLPDKVDVKTGEEEEEEMFCNRAKLYRFDTETKEWKVRGIGNVKILKHSTKGKVRLLMRREQVRKICANHYITSDMILKPNASSDKSWVWNALDYADEEPKTEQLAIRFKTVDEASLFKAKFEEAKKVVLQSPEKAKPQEKKEETLSASESLAARFALKEGEWECSVCCVRNKSTDERCVACQTANPDPSAKPEKQHIPDTKASPFTFKFGIDSSNPSGFTALGASIPPATFTFSTTKPLDPVSVGFGFGFQSSEDFQFGQKDPNFKGFSGAGDQLFSSLPATPTKTDGSNELEDDGMYKTEEHADIQFEPVVQMPDKVDLVTGEEDEEVLYSERVELFRFDSSVSQWKERGVGILKILKNPTNGRFRVLMRRDRSLKVRANHWITTTMNLKPLAGSDRAWMWMANDFSDGDAKPEQLAAEFKSPEFAEEFMLTIEECQKLLLDIPLQNPHKSIDSGRTAHLIQKAEEMKSGLKDLKFFLTDDKTKIKDDDSQKDVGASISAPSLVMAQGETTDLTMEWDNYDLRKEALDDTADSSIYDSPLFSGPPRKKVCRFRESTGGFSVTFQPGISPSKSPTELNQSRASVGTDDKQDTTQEEERDGQYFEPVVQMPDKVDLVTGGEDEEVLYSERVELFRFDSSVSQWKKRGVGVLKILKNPTNGRFRVLMRRDWSLKVRANHWITTTMNLKPLAGSDKAWMWMANDFSDGDAKPEQLAAEFKSPEFAEEFMLTIEECQKLLLDIPLQTPHKSIDSGRTAHLIQKAEEMKSGLKDLNFFLTDDKTKIKDDDSQKDVGASISAPSLVMAQGETTGPKLECDNYDLRKEALDDTADSSIYASPLSSSPQRKKVCHFGESTGGFSVTFQPGISPSKSPTELNQSRASVGTDDKQDTTQEEERDGQYFEPVVQMPDKVDLVTGGEDEEVLYSERVELFRFDSSVSQWKKRGVGVLKILKNPTNGRFRVLMRRDWSLKVRANHWITTTMNLKPLAGSDKAWMWMANDFSDGDAKPEQLAAEFKSPEFAEEFMLTIEECQKLLLDIPLQNPHKSIDSGRTAHLIQKMTKQKSQMTTVKKTLMHPSVLQALSRLKVKPQAPPWSVTIMT